VYGQEAVVPLEFLVPSPRVATITNMTERGTIQERLSQLMSMEEDRILAGFTKKYKKQGKNIGMIDVSREKVSRKET
jgi:hypothetical protein